MSDRHVEATLEGLLRDAPEGAPLSRRDHCLIAYGVSTSVVVLDIAAARLHATRALEHGATVAQLQEIATLVAGLGVHTLMTASRDLADAAEAAGHTLPQFDHNSDELWLRYVGKSPYWRSFDDHFPGALDALRRLSPHAFTTFFEVGSLTFRAEHLTRRTIELASIAVDAIPQHRFLPGLAFHVAGALNTGAGRREIREAVGVGLAAPLPAVIELQTHSHGA